MRWRGSLRRSRARRFGWPRTRSGFERCSCTGGSDDAAGEGAPAEGEIGRGSGPAGADPSRADLQAALPEGDGAGREPSEDCHGPQGARSCPDGPGREEGHERAGERVMEQQVGTEVSRRRRQEKLGIVIRDKMTKTVVVEVRRLVMDPLYHKYLRRRS